MVLWIQWYVAMSAYHASSESAHPRLMLFRPRFFACLNRIVRVHHSTPCLSLIQQDYAVAVEEDLGRAFQAAAYSTGGRA